VTNIRLKLSKSSLAKPKQKDRGKKRRMRIGVVELLEIARGHTGQITKRSLRLRERERERMIRVSD
jgi:hypothetical protein